MQGFDDEGRGAGGEGAIDSEHIFAPRRHDDRQMPRERGGSERLQQFEPAHARHFEVGDDQIIAAAPQMLERLNPVFRDIDDRQLTGKIDLRELAQNRIVVDKKQAGRLVEDIVKACHAPPPTSPVRPNIDRDIKPEVINARYRRDNIRGGSKVRPKTLAAKLAVLVVAALSSAFLATSVVTVWIDATQQARVETERLTQTARVIASVSAEAVAQDDRSGAFAAARAIGQMPGLTYARLEGRSGDVLAETGGGARLLSDLHIGGDGEADLWRTLTTGSIEVATPVMFEGRPVGRLVLFGETPQLRARIFTAVVPALLGVLAATCIGLLVALRMARHISGPIARLARSVRTIRVTQTYEPVEDVQTEGEVADLLAGVNDMIQGIQERDAEIREHVRTLEDKVATRTAELAEAKRAADAANAAKSDFLAVMSHEIRTPLNGILALGDLLGRGDLPARERRYADVIAASGRSLLNVINDILDFSKVEAGKMELEALPFDPADLMEDVAELFAARATEKGLDLAVYVDPRLAQVTGDPSRLRQVLSNLLNNAIKFTDAGGVMLSVRLIGGDVVFEVRDTGPGIPAEVLPTLFDAFTQADQSTTRLHGGTGLGLAICDRLVRAMGGEWQLDSRLGEGSSFAFKAPLPMQPSIPTIDLAGADVGLGDVGPLSRESLGQYIEAFGGRAVPPDQAPWAILGDSEIRRQNDVVLTARAGESGETVLVRPLRRSVLVEVLAALAAGRRPQIGQTSQAEAHRCFEGVTVLVVDDSSVNREVARETLARLGVQVSTADDGVEAVERLSVERFDLVLMDGSMPRLDGFEATRRIRAAEADEGRDRALIYALTAHVIGSAAEAWRDADMDGVVHKPFTLNDLAQVLERHFAERGQASAAFVREPDPSGGALPDDLFDPMIRTELMAMGSDGPDSFVARVERLYRDNAPQRLEALSAAWREDDGEGVSRAAHALKSMSLSLGARRVAELAGAIEKDARDGRMQAETLDRLTSALNATLAAMDGAPAPVAAGAMAQELSVAITEGRLSVAYQALFDSRGVFANKVEALARWQSQTGEWRSPSEFVPALEAEGALSVLTDFVMRRALDDVQRWSGVVVSVNVSADEFQAPAFADRVRRLLAEAAVGPERLEVEVTETAMLSIPSASATLSALSDLGVGVSLDDFGAGYTSLHALRDLPFRALKIDKSFVDHCCDDARSAAIIHAVASVGRALGMKVVCEGVETQRQADFLRIAGAHMLQGFLFHRPAPPFEIETLVVGRINNVA